MKTQFSQPYHAHKSCGVWYILNARGVYECEAFSREQAEQIAAAMTRLAESREEE